MATYADYTTIQDLRAYYLGAQETTDDTLLTQLIRSASREIESLCNRWFYPRIETRLYSARDTMPLRFDADLLSATSLTNGDGTAVTASQFALWPTNSTPAQGLFFLQSAGLTWQPTTAGDFVNNVSLLGVWGYSADYGSAWLDTGLVLSGSVGATGASLPASGTLYAGQLLKIDSEYLYCNTTGSASATAARAVNGSTSGSHAQGATIAAWDFGPVGEIVRVCAAAYYRLRSNPVGETVQLDGLSFSTPKDVKGYMRTQANFLGISRTAVG